VAHLAARIADERAVKDQHGRPDGGHPGDVTVDEVPGGAGRRLG
jgi:hypothetical protein